MRHSFLGLSAKRYIMSPTQETSCGATRFLLQLSRKAEAALLAASAFRDTPLPSERLAVKVNCCN